MAKVVRTVCKNKKWSLTRISEWLFIRLVCWCACAYTSHDGKTHCPSNIPFTVRRAQCGTMVNRTLLGQCIRPSCDVSAHAHHQTGRINNRADISSKYPLFRTCTCMLEVECLPGLVNNSNLVTFDASRHFNWLNMERCVHGDWHGVWWVNKCFYINISLTVHNNMIFLW